MFDDVDLSGSHNGRSIQISNLPDVSVRHRPVRKSKMLRSTFGTRLPATRERTPSSRVLEDLLRQAPPDQFTLGWVLSTLHQRSFGVVILFLGVLATAPIGSSVPGIMLTAVAVQMIAGIREPIFPRFITNRWLPTQYLFRLGHRAIPVLRYLERVVHPRWPRAFDVARRFVGIVVLLLTAALLLTPIPFSNIPPAVLIILIALAYIEEDGLLLCLAFLAAFILIGIASVAVWGTIFGALLISDI
jgi:hypothetical protein